MVEIGRRGFAAFAERHCGGNTAKARAALRLDGRRRDWIPDPWEWGDWLAEREARE